MRKLYIHLSYGIVFSIGWFVWWQKEQVQHKMETMYPDQPLCLDFMDSLNLSMREGLFLEINHYPNLLGTEIMQNAEKYHAKIDTLSRMAPSLSDIAIKEVFDSLYSALIQMDIEQQDLVPHLDSLLLTKEPMDNPGNLSRLKLLLTESLMLNYWTMRTGGISNYFDDNMPVLQYCPLFPKAGDTVSVTCMLIPSGRSTTHDIWDYTVNEEPCNNPIVIHPPFTSTVYQLSAKSRFKHRELHATDTLKFNGKD